MSHSFVFPVRKVNLSARGIILGVVPEWIVLLPGQMTGNGYYLSNYSEPYESIAHAYVDIDGNVRFKFYDCVKGRDLERSMSERLTELELKEVDCEGDSEV